MRVVAGLPRLPGPFDPRVEPVGSVRLQRRLEALTPAERGTLETVVAGFDRGRLAGLDDAAVIARVRAATAVAPPRVRSALEAVWQQRGAAALALRRAAGAPAPDPALFALPGLVPLAVRIVRAWHRPGFALGGPAGEAAREAVAEAPPPFERWRAAILREAQALRAAAFPPAFDLAAVILYVLQWSLVREARAVSADAAERRIRAALEAAAAPLEARLSAAD